MTAERRDRGFGGIFRVQGGIVQRSAFAAIAARRSGSVRPQAEHRPRHPGFALADGGFRTSRGAAA
ncbi:hypothetical protein DLJ53_20790 [Acuticoccus sediminis]|uniref:Uncharacterized protein n=1 Tax=Acuticoccus sediminis TaxID=2184697 RepID=A0A8B2NPF1_9HYPH|nr:hypothetical protein DLJ53_20790 [Acuticoccus sediminis]